MTPGEADRGEQADVSRETGRPSVGTDVSAELPPPPAAAVRLFGDRLDAVVIFGQLLASAGVERGLIGPREVPRLWDRHLLNCGVLSNFVQEGVAVDDVGSGAGLPGIVLALQRPDLKVTLVEPLLRRTAFLHQAVAALGLTSVTVVRERAEERARHSAGVQVVTARAVAPLSRLVMWTMPLLRPGGVLLALKGATAGGELAAAAPALRATGSRAEVLTAGVGLLDPPATIVRVVRERSRDGKRGRVR